MTFKFSRRPLTDLAAVGGIALSLCLGVSSARAQQSAPATDAKPRKAHIRFWNMLPDKPANSLFLLAGDKDSIAGAAPNNVFTSYLPAPSGSYTLVVKRAGQGGVVIQRLPVVLPDEGYITLVASEKNGQPTVEMFNDMPDPKVTELGARLVLRQFFPGAHVKVSVTAGPSSPSVSYGETATLENLPATGSVNILLQAALPTTPPTTKEWPLTADFSTAHHATLLLVADSYGRLRPQLSYDGPPHPAPAAAQ